MTIGIYAIRNKVNGKVYVGKSKNIEKRFWQHKNLLSKGKCVRSTNRHLLNAVQKYGIENFELIILEEFPEVDEVALADSEVKWMDALNSLNRDCGYNLKRDSSQNVIFHPETIAIISENNKGDKNGNFGNHWTDEQRHRMSEIKKAQFADGTYDFMKTEEHRKFLSESSKKTWQDEEKRGIMARKVAEAKSELRFEQYDKHTGELIAVYDSMMEIIDKYPDFHKIAIYSVCNGWKKSYRGFIWKSIQK